MNDMRSIPAMLSPGESWPQRRDALARLFAENLYGEWPAPGQYSTSFSQQQATSRQYGTVRCQHLRYQVSVQGQHGQHSFPLEVLLPETEGPHPVILYLLLDFNNTRDGFLAGGDWGEAGLPPLDILRRGYALALLYGEQAEPDSPESFPTGLAAALCGRQRTATSMGCLSTWAFALSRSIDCIEAQSWADKEHIVVAGCSRCGKAALWCSAQDSRVFCTASFNSGCGGAALSRMKQGERIGGMQRSFPHWLCLAALEYAEKEEALPLDQHMLLGLVAPRLLFVSSATQDAWADPYGEFLACVYAQAAYQQCGREGLGTSIWPPAGHLLKGDGIGYYLRVGNHGVEADDWAALLDFV